MTSPKYAKDQPSGFSNTLTRIAVVGGTGGRLGKHIVAELEKLSHVRIRVLTRGSSSTPPSSATVEMHTVQYDDHRSLVNALRGQEMLIILLAVTAPPDTSQRLADAAAEAGVRWVVPNAWACDIKDATARKESIIGEPKQAECDYLTSKSVAWIAISCGAWFEYSIAGGLPRFGIDVLNKTAHLYDGGTVAVSTSTWDQTARAVAALAALPQYPIDANDTSTLTISHWADRYVHISSFTLTQRQILDAVQTATQTSDSDWTIVAQSAHETYKAGMKRLEAGDLSVIGHLIYVRLFFNDRVGDMANAHGLDNEQLGLPQDDLMTCTRSAVAMSVGR